MPGVFLSHSSLDKPLIAKLAIDLLARGMPVWFDSWEVDAGDSLHERIYEGLDASTFVVVALSPNSTQSRWVQREMTAALAMEERLGRKVILPIKIAECDVPLAIADRIYADTSRGYLRGVEQLERVLRRHGADRAEIPFQQQLLPVVFTKSMFVDKVGLRNGIQRLLPGLKAGGKLQASQVLIAPDAHLDALRDNLLHIVDTIADHPNYSPEVEHYFRSTYDYLRRLEEALLLGITDIVNGLASTNNWGGAEEAIHWYARIVRNDIIADLIPAWHFNEKGELPVKVEVRPGAMTSNFSAAAFFGVEGVRTFDIFRRETNEYFKVWLPDDSSAGRWFKEYPQVPDSLTSFWDSETMYKYVVPQMVAGHRLHRSREPEWDLTGWMIGLS